MDLAHAGALAAQGAAVVGFGVVTLGLGHLVRLGVVAAARAGRSWRVVARHQRRAASARASARAARARLLAEQNSAAYATLRRARGDSGPLGD